MTDRVLGPWRWDYYTDGTCGSEGVLLDTDDELVMRYEGLYPLDARTRALFAAAPQLLAACEARVADWEPCTRPGAACEGCPDPPDVAMARAAIAAALGPVGKPEPSAA